MSWTAPRTWVAGETVTAALLNTHLRDNLKAVGDAWTAYTPGWSGSGGIIGSGLRVGAFMQAGKLVLANFRLTVGGSTTLTGTYDIGLPVAAKYTADSPVGQVFIRDLGTAVYMRNLYTPDGSNCRGSSEAGTLVGAASPMAAAGGDTFTGSLYYEAA